MKLQRVAVILGLVSFAAMGQPDLETAPSSRSRSNRASMCPPHVWLGLRVAKPDETVTAHLPSLPQGFGFVIASVDAGGPAQAAGLVEYDIIWKMGDQMLVNEAQLAALLRLSKAGDAVVISGFRAGKPLEVKLTLGEVQAPQKPFSGDLVESAIMPGACSGPMRLINVADKTASFSTDDSRAVVRRNGEFFEVKISGVSDAVIFEGSISSADDLAQIPESWQRRVHVLCRTLDQALVGGGLVPRQPRPRVVIPIGEKP